jgi:heptose I phosphotransferase
VARRFHAAGFNHRDFYCCHFFIQELPGPRFAIRLIDLQRVEQRHWLRRRWIVKDLAQLAYSAPRERIGRTLRLAFIKRYLGVARLSPADKRFVRRVLRRQLAMQRRLGEHP